MLVTHQDQSIEIKEGSTGLDLCEKLNLRDPHQSLALLVNGQIKDLATPLHQDDEVSLVHFEDKEGKEVFWHTSAHVLAQAVLRLWPDAQPTIGPPIEQGFYYDFANLSISDEDFPLIEKEVQKIIKENYKPVRKVFSSKKEALHIFGQNPYKKELIESFDENGEITGYQQGEFFDLCRGPHLPAIGKIKAFKILKTSGAYWKGDAKNAMLTRIYAISFPDKDLLKDYLHMIEEAKKRDHRDPRTCGTHVVDRPSRAANGAARHLGRRRRRPRQAARGDRSRAARQEVHPSTQGERSVASAGRQRRRAIRRHRL